MQRLGAMKRKHVMRHKREHAMNRGYEMKPWAYTGPPAVHNPERVKLPVRQRRKRGYLLLYLRIIGRDIDRRNLKRVDRGNLNRANSEVAGRST